MTEHTNEFSQEFLEAVERYRNRAMSADESEAFKQKLNSDSEFKTKVKDVLDLLTGIETQCLKDNLNKFHKAIPQESKITETQNKPKVISLFIKRILVAVAASLLLAFGYFQFFVKNSSEQLFNTHFSPDPGLPTTMSSTDNYTFYEAMVDYKLGEYDLAIKKWHPLLENKPKNDTLNYFIGVAHLALKKEKNAITYLKKTTIQSESYFYKDANYYLGLAYLKSGDTNNAKICFERSSNHKSKEILNQINN